MKKKIKIIDGKAIYNKQEFCFNYTDNILTLYPKELEDRWKSLEMIFTRHYLKDTDSTITIYGETNDGNPIAFIKLKIRPIGRGIYRSYVPAYIIGKCNAIDPLPKIKDFKSITFKGSCIDRIYNPMGLVKSIGLTKKFKPVIKFNDFKDVTNKIVIDKDIWKFNIEWSVPNSDKNTVFTVNSFLRIDFSTLKNVEEVVEYYIRIQKLLGFLNNRSHIVFSEIKLYQNINFYDDISKENKKDFVTFLLNINEDEDKEYDLPKWHNQISILYIKEHLKDLYYAVNDDVFINNSLPDNTYESEHMNLNTFLQTASAFESEFDRTYPKYKATKSKDYREIKSKVLNFIKECKTSEKTKANKYLDTFYDTINNLEGTLPEQICYALNEYSKPIAKVKKRIFDLYGITDVSNDELAQVFSKKRNHISHGRELKAFSNIEIVTYILVERLIYCLLLERVGFSKEEITVIIEKIFE